MKTLIEKKKITDHSGNVLAEATLQTINKVKDFVDFNEYSLNKTIEIESFSSDLKGKIGEMSLNQRKKYKRIINKFMSKGSLRSANRFLHYLYKKVLGSELRITITYSEKQLKIVATREKYVQARKAMIEAYKLYKEEKGDFFKSRLNKNQNIQ